MAFLCRRIHRTSAVLAHVAGLLGYSLLFGATFLQLFQPGLPSTGLAPTTRIVAAATSGFSGVGTASTTDTAAALPLAGLVLLSAMALKRSGRHGSGRVVVRGRNYEKNIKQKKGPAEAKKAAVTRKHLNNIILQVREHGPDEATNHQLTRVIKSALKDNVPRSTIDARIKKFVEGKEAVEEVTFGGYSLGGAAIMVHCVTDNQNRTRTEVREVFKDASGAIGTEGCVDHLFTKQGVVCFEHVDEETIVEASLEADVEDCKGEDDGTVIVTTLPETLQDAQKVFEDQGLEWTRSEVQFTPVMPNELNEEAKYEVHRLIYNMRDLDDVTDVYTTAVDWEDTQLKFNPYGIAEPFKRAKK